MASNTVVQRGFVLQARDLAIIAIIAVLGVVEGRMICDLLFGSVPRGNFRLAQSVAAGYLVRYSVPSSPRFARVLYRLGPAALELVPQALAAHNVEPETSELERMLRPVPLSRLAHTLALGQIFAVFHRATATGPVRMERFLPEWMLWTRFTIREPNGRRTTHCFAPDGFARVEIAVDGLPVNIFIECDLGSVNSADLTGKLAAWSAFLRGGLADETFGDGHHMLLVVAPDAARVGRLSRLALRHGTPAVLFSTFDDLARHGIGPGYRTARSATTVSLMELPMLFNNERNETT